MEKLHFSIQINAPKEKVWRTMLDDELYKEWTSVFAEGSSYQGSWEKGSNIVFSDGEGNGMVSKIADNRPYEYVSIQHFGIIKDDVEDTTSEEAKKWAPAFENYTFRDKDGGTELIVEMDTNEEYADMFNTQWPQALQKLKELAEQ